MYEERIQYMQRRTAGLLEYTTTQSTGSRSGSHLFQSLAFPDRKLRIDCTRGVLDCVCRGTNFWNEILPSLLNFLIIFTKLFIMLIRARHLRKVMPPGPTGLPLLGNVLEMPKKETWKKLGEWKQQYGPINSLNMAGQPLIILNTQEVVTDLLDRRSAIYADRPHFVMVNDVLCGGMNLGFMPYGDLWRKYRRALHEVFNTHAVASFAPMQSHEAVSLTSVILKDPEDWEHHIQRFAASAVLRATYGWSLFDTANRDQTLEKIIAFIDVTSHASIPGNFLVNIFPSMMNIPEWFPGAKWKREGMRTQRKFEGLFLELVEDVCGNKGESEAEHCLTAKLVENEKKYGLERRETAWLTGVMFAAGSGTTANTLCTFVLAMTLHPDVLQRAHAELDSVVGRNRAPTFEDKLDLPYIDAIVKEVLRWRPIAPLGIPRRCTKDDWYRGYLIPKGATIFENIWSIAHDPISFPEPEEFRPSRFLRTEESDYVEISDEFEQEILSSSDKLFAFGFGRRICPGKHLAYNSLFIAISTLLWACDIEQALDKDGNPIVPDRNAFLDTGVVILPAPFKCHIRPRFSGVENLVDSNASK